ncbi:hypothetical protein PRIPAC_74404 [Pristionchus pacificus]|uniref:Uncharacterized protein n=1 Tax=Pristionchus pacificus TaxID=54126 RepID=A0A2A6B543_PRIPA|nr:hypothetical protein PRIPAC_74404 [Pristionchus pacificus]|eukprot:PDM60973.1 hypothetical protein PRIPAC_54779 [Pristionchus pacificus]
MNNPGITASWGTGSLIGSNWADWGQASDSGNDIPDLLDESDLLRVIKLGQALLTKAGATCEVTLKVIFRGTSSAAAASVGAAAGAGIAAIIMSGDIMGASGMTSTIAAHGDNQGVPPYPSMHIRDAKSEHGLKWNN